MTAPLVFAATLLGILCVVALGVAGAVMALEWWFEHDCYETDGDI